MQRRIKKQFWLSPQDARELKRKAKLCGITETAVIRILLHGYEPKEKPDARFYEAMRQLSAIGNNINQIARRANVTNKVYKEDIAEIKELGDKLCRPLMFLQTKVAQLKH